MRDPLNWSIPLFRAFGIQVRLHFAYIIVALAMMFRQIERDSEHWLDYLLISIVLLFVIVLLHEFGHCFAARREGGDADKILMWPLGGLAYCDIPHSPRAHFNTAFGGPLVNILICLGCAAILVPLGFLPPLNPFNSSQVWSPELHNWHDGQAYVSREHPRVVKVGTEETVWGAPVVTKDGHFLMLTDDKQAFEVEIGHQPRYGTWIVWTARIFWLSWLLFLFNVCIPAFPLDGGRLLQSLVWGRTDDYRKGTMVAVYAGIAVAIIFLFFGFLKADPLFTCLGIFILFSCYQQWTALEMQENESVFGYDFSQGYTSLEKEEPPQPKVKKQGMLRRWLEARRLRRTQREAEQKVADELRMDELLDKIHRKETLSDEEKRFMDRVSARYRNKSGGV